MMTEVEQLRADNFELERRRAETARQLEIHRERYYTECNRRSELEIENRRLRKELAAATMEWRP